MGKYNSILEYDDAIAVLRDKNLGMIDTATLEIRSLSESETSEFEANKAEILALEAEKEEFERNLNDENTKKQLKNISIDNKMENKEKFSLGRAICEAYQNHEKYVTLSRALTVADEGNDTVPVDFWECMRPLLEEKVFNKIGARIETNLHDNVQIPVLQSSYATWNTENGEASEATPAFTNVTLSPKRFACFVPISKKWLIQSTKSSQAAVMEDIANYASAIIENQVWSDEAASETHPAGLCYNLSYTTVGDYNDLVNLEADLRQEKFDNISVVMSPHAEADLKSMIRGTNATGMVLENGKVDGLDSHVTSILPTREFVLIDGRQLVMGFWGNTELQIIEDSYYAKRGQVCIVVNGYADFKLARPNAIKLGKTSVS